MGLSRPVRLSATALASAGLVTTGLGFPTSQLAHAEGRTVMATTDVRYLALTLRGLSLIHI